MPPLAVVERLDVIEDGALQLPAVWPRTATDELLLQGGEERLGDGKFGTIVALSANGNTALIGAWNDNHSEGAAWVFTRSGSTWTQQGPKLTGGGETGEGRFGVAVALSADGATGLIGAWRDNSGTGAAWAFVNPYEATTAVATNIGESGATLNGTLAGGSGKAYFQYGTAASYGASTSAQGVGASGSPSPLAATVGGLAPGTTYHFRLVAENSGGVVYGNDQMFTTDAQGEPPKPPCCGPDPGKPPRVLLVQDVRQSTTRWRLGIGSPRSVARGRRSERPSPSRSTTRQP